MFLKLFFISMAVLAIGIFLMSIQIIFGRRKEFPDYRIGHNSELRKRNIYCPKTEQKIIDGQTSGSGCSGCF